VIKLKTVVLGNGRAQGRRVEVESHADELSLPVDPSDRFGAWMVYRPSGRKAADGFEVWCEHVDSGWAETASVDL
jgi:hypothetical protein